MICVDASALIAIQFGEPEAKRFTEEIANSTDAAIGAPTALEYLMVVVGRYGPEGGEAARTLLQNLRLIAFTPEMLDLAAEAFIRFGKGRHPAGLNYGDCMAYALAKSFDAPLLYKGADFSKTDIEAAV